jgi:integrase
MAGKKRANGEGSISQHPDGRWWARLTLADGKRKAYYGKTRREVQQKLTAALRDQQQGLPVVGERQTFGEYLSWWLETCKRPRLRPNTYRRYSDLARLHITPRLGKVPLSKLTPQHLTDLYGRRLDAGLSRRSVQFIHAVAHGALKQALRLNLIARNPAAAVDAPRPERREMQVLTPAQAQALLTTAEGHRLEALFVLALTTGMRMGEILALRWRDVDLDARRLHVRATLQRVNGAWSFAEPKTAKSRRSIVLSARAILALRSHRARQLAEIAQAGDLWVSYDLVFPGRTGAPLSQTNFAQQHLHPLLKRAGLPLIRPHDLRHSCGTILLKGGKHPKYVQELLGHSQIGMTLDTYSHVIEGMHQEVADYMDEVFKTG